MIDTTPVLVIDLRGGCTPAGRPRQIAMVVNAQGFTLAYSTTHPAGNIRDAFELDAMVVTIGATPAEIRERTDMAERSGRMLPIRGRLTLATLAETDARAMTIARERMAGIAS